MKRYSSRFLKSVAMAYMAFPAVYLVAAALLFDIPANLCLRILISPSYYFLGFWAVLSGYGLWEMRRWAWYLFILTNVFVIYSNAVLASDYGETHHKVIAIVFSIAVPLLLIYRVSREVRVPYFLPKIRWWESNPRFKLAVPVSLQLAGDGAALAGDILDLSMGGCFIRLRTDLTQDVPISLQFTVFGQNLHCAGTVVWRTQSTVTHPKGIGVKFGPLTRPQKRVLRAVNQRLRKIATLYRSSRYLMSQEDFFKRLDELQSARLEIPALKASSDK